MSARRSALTCRYSMYSAMRASYQATSSWTACMTRCHSCAVGSVRQKLGGTQVVQRQASGVTPAATRSCVARASPAREASNAVAMAASTIGPSVGPIPEVSAIMLAESVVMEAGIGGVGIEAEGTELSLEAAADAAYGGGVGDAARRAFPLNAVRGRGGAGTSGMLGRAT